MGAVPGSALCPPACEPPNADLRSAEALKRSSNVNVTLTCDMSSQRGTNVANHAGARTTQAVTPGSAIVGGSRPVDWATFDNLLGRCFGNRLGHLGLVVPSPCQPAPAAFC